MKITKKAVEKVEWLRRNETRVIEGKSMTK